MSRPLHRCQAAWIGLLATIATPSATPAQGDAPRAAARPAAARPAGAQKQAGGQGGPSNPGGNALPSDRLAGARSVALPELREWLGRLASNEFAGRGTGSPGFELAAEMVADHFEALGLEPRGDDGTFFQRVPWERTTVDAENTRVVFRKGEQRLELLASDLGGSLRSNAEVQAPVTLVVVREADAGGIRDLDLAGRTAILWSPNPELLSNRRTLYRAMAEVRRAKAAATLIVNDALFAQAGGLTGGTSPGGARGRTSRGARRMPTQLFVTESNARALLELAGLDPTALDESQLAFELADVEADVRITGTVEPAPAFNVVGVLPGSDPKLRDEYVVIGSHLDHLGRRGQTVHPGADDDASGTTGVLAVAQMFAKNPARPRRSVLFTTFCGEENGLIGSRYFAENPPIPLASMVGELQMDMIGRNEERGREKAEDNLNCLHLVGTEKLSTDLHELCLARNREFARFDLEWDEENVFYRSDHWNFARKGVPIAFFFTGFHPDYHRPSDTADKIDYGKLLRIATYVYDIGFTLAQSDTRPMVDAAKWESLARKGAKEPAAPVRRN